MNWDDLRIFLCVARTQRLNAAARELGVDATTIGRRLARLERDVDATLFEQGPAGYVLTERGRALVEHAEAAEQAALRFGGDVTGEAGPGGTVRVSVVEGFGTWIVARALPDFHRRHPRIVIDLVAGSGVLSPSRREADIAIMLARPQHGPLVARRLTDYRLGLYASPAYLDSAGMPGARTHLLDHSIVGYVPDHIFTPELDYLGEVLPGLEPAIRSTSINAQWEMIAGGGGIGVLPRFMAAEDARLVPVLADDVSILRSFWLVMHRDMRRFARIAAFSQWIDEAVAQRRDVLL